MKSRNPPLSILVPDTKGLNLLDGYILKLLRLNWEKLFVKLTVELTVKPCSEPKLDLILINC